MREATFADPVDKAIKRYEHAVEQLGKVAHYVDRAARGRAATDLEMQEFATRSKAVADTLHAICAAPCTDFKALRRKAKFLSIFLLDRSIGQRDGRALVQSILQMAKGTDAS